MKKLLGTVLVLMMMFSFSFQSAESFAPCDGRKGPIFSNIYGCPTQVGKTWGMACFNASTQLNCPMGWYQCHGGPAGEECSHD